jgi:hypothetical protein
MARKTAIIDGNPLTEKVLEFNEQHRRSTL